MSQNSSFNRRGFLSAGGAVGFGLLLAACGDDTSAKEPVKAGPDFTFVDDRKKTITLPEKPKKVVAFTGTAAALKDFGVTDQIVGVFGPTTLKDGRPDPQAGDLDVARLTVIGNVYGEFSIEKYAALQPQLLVSPMYEPEQLWYVPEESKDKILGLAPSIALTVSRLSLPAAIKRHEELAAALGADLNAAPVQAARTRFEKAADAVREAAKANPVKVLACSGAPELFYASNPALAADLTFFKELGVDLIVPDKLDKEGYFESLSWENADKYQADVLLLDNRSMTLQPEALKAKPSWAKLPAVKAGQIVPWASEPRFSYAGVAPILENLAAVLKSTKKLG